MISNSYRKLIFNHPYDSMNLVPFIDVLNGRGDFIRQVGLNVIMNNAIKMIIAVPPLIPNSSHIFYYSFLA